MMESDEEFVESDKFDEVKDSFTSIRNLFLTIMQIRSRPFGERAQVSNTVGDI